MSYTKRDFQPNTTLYASELNLMDDQIALNESNIDALNNTIVEMNDAISDLEVKTQCFDSDAEDGIYIVDTTNNVVSYIDRNGTYSTNFTTPSGNFNNIAAKNTVTTEIWKGEGQHIYVQLEGLTAGKSYKIELMRRPSRSSDAKKWQSFPSNYGYAMLVSEGYGDVPDFMTNGGVLENIWEFTATYSTYVLDLDAHTWLLDLCKPLNNTSFSQTDGESVGLIGQSFARPFKMLCFTFYVYDENNIMISKPAENLYINGTDSSTANLQLTNDGSEITLNNIRISIK